jgi:hypothetical protein
VATDVLDDDHVPPVVASINVVVIPEHTVRIPTIAVGNGFTVNTAVVWQPLTR